MSITPPEELSPSLSQYDSKDSFDKRSSFYSKKFIDPKKQIVSRLFPKNNLQVQSREVTKRNWAKEEKRKRNWILMQLKSLQTIEKKIAQLFIVDTTSFWGKDITNLSILVFNEGIGGVIYTAGEALHQSRLIDKFQQIAHIPLFIAHDVKSEWGLFLESLELYPSKEAFQRVKDPPLLGQFGRHLALQFSLLGINAYFYEEPKEVFQNRKHFLEGLNLKSISCFGKLKDQSYYEEENRNELGFTLDFFSNKLNKLKVFDLRKKSDHVVDLFNEGNLFLLDENIFDVLDQIKKGIDSGKISLKLLDQKVLKMLYLKQSVHLNKPFIPLYKDKVKELNPTLFSSLKKRLYMKSHRKMSNSDLITQHKGWYSIGNPLHPLALTKLYQSNPFLTHMHISLKELNLLTNKFFGEEEIIIACFLSKKEHQYVLFNKIETLNLNQVTLIFFTKPFFSPVLKKVKKALYLWDQDKEAQNVALDLIYPNNNEKFDA